MIRIQIEPVWRFTKDEGARSMLVMLDFLHEIRTTGKITRAAEQTGMSQGGTKRRRADAPLLPWAIG